MAQTKKKPTKARARIKTGVALKKKGSTRDSLKRAPTRLAPDVGANFRIKIRKK